MTLPLVAAGSGEERISLALVRREIQWLAEDFADMLTYRSYYEGEHPLVFASPEFDDAFGGQFLGFRDNWMPVIVDAVADRLVLEGFEIQPDEDGVDQNLSTAVWRTMQLNDIDSQSAELHTSALVEGRAYVIVWPHPERGATIDWNPGFVVRVRYDDDDPQRVRWAVKRWRTTDNRVLVTMYFPDRIEKYIENRQSGAGPEHRLGDVRNLSPDDTETIGGLQRRFVLDPTTGEQEPWPLPNPFGVVPVVEFNNPRGSEIRDQIPQQDALNKTIIDSMVTSEFSAFAQRWVLSKNNQPQGGWRKHPGSILQFLPTYDTEGKADPFQIGTFPTNDPASYIKLVEMYLQHIALTSKTPMRMFFQSDRGGRGDAPSGESLLIEDIPLLKKVARRQVLYGNAWAQVARLVWASIERVTPRPLALINPTWEAAAQDHRFALIEMALKQLEIGLPFDFVVTKIGLTPGEIEVVLEMKRANGTEGLSGPNSTELAQARAAALATEPVIDENPE